MGQPEDVLRLGVGPCSPSTDLLPVLSIRERKPESGRHAQCARRLVLPSSSVRRASKKRQDREPGAHRIANSTTRPGTWIDPTRPGDERQV
jgi:hypothetical protein